MPDYHHIYTHEAVLYDQLVSCEDYQGNILATLQRIYPLHGLNVVESGAGTGRLTCLLAPFVNHLRIYDASRHMLDVAITKLSDRGWGHWQAGVADHHTLPVPDDCADLVISGWSLCYVALDHPGRWRASIEDALDEFERVLKPGGMVILLETQGTGFERPDPPEILKDYFKFLIQFGFKFDWFRTDYRFGSIEEAVRLVRFFFGEELVEKTLANNWVILPECTGIWWLSK